jgi:hypothetical protein
MHPLFRLSIYLAGLGWAYRSGMPLAMVGQLSGLASAVVFFSYVFEKRAGSPGRVVASYLELAFASTVIFCEVGKAEFVWLAAPAITLGGTESRLQAIRVGLSAAIVVAATVVIVLIRNEIPVALIAAAIGLPLIGMVGRDRPTEEEVEPEVIVDEEGLRSARDAERAARRGYRELVALYKQLKGAYDETDLSLRFSSAALASDRPLDKLMEAVVEVTGAAGATLWLPDPQNQMVTVRSCFGNCHLKQERVPMANVTAVAKSLAVHGSIIAEQGLAGGAKVHQEHLLREGARILGVLTLRPAGKTKPLQRVDDALARITAPISHLLRHEAMQYKLDFAEARLQASDLAVTADGMSVVARKAIDLLHRFADADHWSVWMLDWAGMPVKVGERGRPLEPLEAMGLDGAAFRTWAAADEPWRIPDITAEPALSREKVLRIRMRSVLGVPLSSGGKAVGAVVAAHASPDMFGATERGILLRLSAPIARALELASIRERPFAVVRLEGATGLYSYKEFSERLKEQIDGTPELLGISRFVVDDSDDERFEAVGRAVAEAFRSHGFASLGGERELVGCLVGLSREQMQAIADLLAARFTELRLVGQIAMLGQDGENRFELIEAVA